MPKVVISNSKGLVQEAGSGFELSDSHVKPAIETCRHAVQVLTFTGPDVAGAINGTYFDISSDATNYRVYFDIAGDESAEPADLGGRTAVMANLAAAVDTDAATAAEQAGAIETALDALDFIADTAAGGQISVFCDTPGALANAFDAGTTAEAGHETAATVSATDGDGQLALTVDKRVSIIGQTAAGAGDDEITGQDAFTLGDGAYAGQEKIIMLDGVGTEAQTVTVNSAYTTAADDGLASLTLTLTHAASECCNIHLLWDGAGWVALSTNGSAAVA